MQLFPLKPTLLVSLLCMLQQANTTKLARIFFICDLMAGVPIQKYLEDCNNSLVEKRQKGHKTQVRIIMESFKIPIRNIKVLD